jgi:uncharacterized protein
MIQTLNTSDVQVMLRNACKKIAPVWPLENFVAVNPYLGLINRHFEEVAYEMVAVGGVKSTMPVEFYMSKLQEGQILREDVSFVLKYRNHHFADDIERFLNSVSKADESEELKFEEVPTVAEIAKNTTGKDWQHFMISRISLWASSYFDKGQAVWSSASKNDELFISWKKEAELDLTPEIMGIKGFRKFVKKLPNEPIQAAAAAWDIIGIQRSGFPYYLHRLLLKNGGWSAFVARYDWEKELSGEEGNKLTEFLTIILCWEACLIQSLDHVEFQTGWKHIQESFSGIHPDTNINVYLSNKLLLQEAYEIAVQREIVNKFSKNKRLKAFKSGHVKAQAVFCIDVRSEVYRRNLEIVDAGIETLGFAGFFGFPVNYAPFGRETGFNHCPVLLKASSIVREKISDEQIEKKALTDHHVNNQVRSAWKSFKSGAISCFSFVSPLGLSYIFKLVTDSFGLTHPVSQSEKNGFSKNHDKHKKIGLDIEINEKGSYGIVPEQRVQMAKNALKAMSLTEGFAPLVMIVGHGSTSVNNPHASGLDCGACGGRSGEPNARVAADILNDHNVRLSLAKEGIQIPESTLFLACLHDTTTDNLIIFNEGVVPAERSEELKDLKKSLQKASSATRLERSVRMSVNGENNTEAAIRLRSKDWSQIRPEWGLAGCCAFIVAPRDRTKHINLNGRSFLHSYNWKKDTDFSVLELIMTAPMIVASWISLQYYGSTVDNKTFGSGNKVLHNVTAGVGVLEGASGDLQIGLPWQSLHDGEKLQHEPVRLNVIIEAPVQAMNNIIRKYAVVRDLCDNGWLYLWAMNNDGLVSHRYRGNFSWENVNDFESFKV